MHIPYSEFTLREHFAFSSFFLVLNTSIYIPFPPSPPNLQCLGRKNVMSVIQVACSGEKKTSVYKHHTCRATV